MTDIPRDADGFYTKEYCDAKMEESFARSKALREEFKVNLATIRAKVKGQIRKAQKRNREIRDLLHTEEYVVRENLLRRGHW